jgi:hypothetical protein
MNAGLMVVEVSVTSPPGRPGAGIFIASSLPSVLKCSSTVSSRGGEVGSAVFDSTPTLGLQLIRCVFQSYAWVTMSRGPLGGELHADHINRVGSPRSDTLCCNRMA